MHVLAAVAAGCTVILLLPSPPVQPPALLCAALWAVGTSYYFYITFLGYSALPFLEKTEVRGSRAGQAVADV